MKNSTEDRNGPLAVLMESNPARQARGRTGGFGLYDRRKETFARSGGNETESRHANPVIAAQPPLGVRRESQGR